MQPVIFQITEIATFFFVFGTKKKNMADLLSAMLDYCICSLALKL